MCEHSQITSKTKKDLDGENASKQEDASTNGYSKVQGAGRIKEADDVRRNVTIHAHTTSSSTAVTAEPFSRIAYLHDVINLWLLAVLIGLDINYLINATGFLTFFWCTMVYFVLDIGYVAMWPASVKSPMVIVIHHVVAALYTLIPFYYERYQWTMAYCMVIEISTWLLIARRIFRHPAISVLFYISWVLLRNIWYPYLLYLYTVLYLDESKAVGTYFNVLFAGPFIQTLLTGLNYFWSLQLVFRPKRVKQL